MQGYGCQSGQKPRTSLACLKAYQLGTVISTEAEEWLKWEPARYKDKECATTVLSSLSGSSGGTQVSPLEQSTAWGLWGKTLLNL